MSTSKVMITFTDDTTDKMVDDAMQTLKKNGGEITNDFRPLMKGFAAVVPAQGLDALKSDSVVGDKIVRIELDQEVRTQG